MHHHARALLLLAALLIAGAAWAQEQTQGWLGAHLQEVTKEEAHKLGWQAPRGVKILRPMNESPAETAGLEPGDVVVTLDGAEVENGHAFVAALKSKSDGTPMTLGLMRGGKEMTVSVTLGARPEVYALDEEVTKLIQARKYGEAMPIAQRALALAEQRFGPDDVQVSGSLVRIALLHHLQRRAGNAVPFFSRALAIQEKALGADHLDVAATLVLLGACPSSRWIF